MTDQKIVERIKALLNQAESTTYEAEADAFYAKAQQMMIQHAVDEAMLAAAGKKQREEIVTQTVEIRIGIPGTEPRQIFLNRIAHALNCRMWYTTETYDYRWDKRKQKTVPKKRRSKFNTVCGYESDVEFVQILFMSVQLQLQGVLLREVGVAREDHTKAMMEKYGDAYWRYDEKEMLKRFPFRESVWRRNFIDGYLSRVASRIEDRYRKVEQTHGHSAALALRDRGTQIDDWVKENITFSGEAAKRKEKEIDWHARGRGSDRGDQADISGGRGHLKNERKELNG